MNRSVPVEQIELADPLVIPKNSRATRSGWNLGIRQPLRRLAKNGAGDHEHVLPCLGRLGDPMFQPLVCHGERRSDPQEESIRQEQCGTYEEYNKDEARLLQ